MNAKQVAEINDGSTEIAVEVSNRTDDDIPSERIIRAVRSTLQLHGVASASVGVIAVGGAEMHALNLRFLNHDYLTDVLTFPLGDGGAMEGEVVFSVDYARSEAAAHSWSAESEMILYCVHGTLHLLGFDDATQDLRIKMRKAEVESLRSAGEDASGASPGDRRERNASCG